MSDAEMSADEDYNDYYNDEQDPDVDTIDKAGADPEYFEHYCLDGTDTRIFVQDQIKLLGSSLNVGWTLSNKSVN